MIEPLKGGTTVENLLKHYWVTFTGTLLDGDGGCGIDPDSPNLTQPFLGEVTRELIRHEDVHSPAVFTYSTGKVILAGVLKGSSDGNALDYAKAAFAVAITRAGGTSRIPDGTDPSWQISRLLKYGTVQEVEESSSSTAA